MIAKENILKSSAFINFQKSFGEFFKLREIFILLRVVESIFNDF